MTSLEILTDRSAVGLDRALLEKANRTAIALLIIRVSVFLVMLIWTIYRLVRLEHAISISEHFYSITGATAGTGYMPATAGVMYPNGFAPGMGPRNTDGDVCLLESL